MAVHPVQVVVPARRDPAGVPVGEVLLADVLGHERGVDLEDVLDGRVWVLHQQGVKQRDIAQEVGKSPSTVNRIIKRLEALS